MRTGALILTDLQNDFLPGGALPVPGGQEVVPLANRLMREFDLVVAIQDWHPRNHVSFAVNHPGRKVRDVVQADGLEQILWPVHCVQGSWGADFHPDLNRSGLHEIVRKGVNPRVDSYSAFRDNARQASTRLEGLLRERGVEEVYIAGVATDFCVRATAMDALDLGFRTSMVLDACRGIAPREGDICGAVEEMRRSGVIILESPAVLSRK
jgi:nicotinamidase/pyrazinamidase